MNLKKQSDGMLFQDLINEYEMIRTNQMIDDFQSTKISFLFRVESLAFADAMAEIYGQTKTEIYNDCLAASFRSLLVAMPSKLRLAVARRADERYEQLMQENAERQGGTWQSTESYWQAIVRAIELNEKAEQSEEVA